MLGRWELYSILRFPPVYARRQRARHKQARRRCEKAPVPGVRIELLYSGRNGASQGRQGSAG